MALPPLDVVTICGRELATLTIETETGVDSPEMVVTGITALLGEGFFFFGSVFFLLTVRTAAFAFGLTFFESDTICDKSINLFLINESL